MFPLLSQDELLERQQTESSTLIVLDVRRPDEFAAGHVPGARNVPHDQVADRLDELPTDKDLVIYCRSGGRATYAAQVLAANGYTKLLHLEGDMLAWAENDRPVEIGPR